MPRRANFFTPRHFSASRKVEFLRNFSVFSGGHAGEFSELAVEVIFAFEAAGVGDFADAAVAFEEHGDGHIEAFLEDILLGGDFELFGEQAAEVGRADVHEFAEFGIGDLVLDVVVDVFENRHEPRGTRVDVIAVFGQKFGNKEAQKSFAGEPIGDPFLVFRFSDDVGKQLHDGFIGGQGGYDVFCLENGKVAGGGDIQVEMDPVMLEDLVTMRIEQRKSRDEIEIPGDKFELFIVF